MTEPMMANSTVSGSFVCSRCLDENPTRVDLISNKCLRPDQHANEPRVSAVWTPEGGLERVRDKPKSAVPRPMPKVHFRGHFVLCDGGRCKGEKCTFPHSKEERDEWNKKKFSGIKYLRSSSPNTMVTLGPPSISPPHVPAAISSKLATYADSVTWNLTPLAPVSPPTPVALVSSTPQVPVSPPTPSSHFPASPHYNVEVTEPLHSSQEQLPWPDYNEMRHKAAQSPCQPPQASFGSEFTSPMHGGNAPRIPLSSVSQPPPPVTRDASRMHRQLVANPPPAKQALLKQNAQTRQPPVCLQERLGRDNYRQKFKMLLRSEERAHVQILDEKCNGQYKLVLHQAGLKSPNWMRFEADPKHKRYGFVSGLSGDQIAYATQASEGAFITCSGGEIRASVLRENFNLVEERMYIAFDAMSVQKLEQHLHVTREHCKRDIILRFKLKHSYFRNLHDSVEELPQEAIERIVPQRNDFQAVQLRRLPKRCRSILKLDHCSDDQVRALEAIVSCPCNGPPVLVSGPFGTGKTRILATAAHYFIQEDRNNGRPVRVLVCTQQHVSADTFLEHYLDLMTTKERDLNILRLAPTVGNRNPKLKRWYKTVQHFKRDFERSSQSNESSFLIITTCLTALHVADVFVRGFFTHILLDEGAQMREPEGIAPLCLATKHTKIIIAGDEHQVGPAMLVLGEEARKNGLATSLLERLHKLYQEFGEAANHYSTTLVTNYRCHQKILNLAERLFYDQQPLKCRVPDMSAHPDAPFPLLFVCSSIDDTLQSIVSNTNENEARIVLEQVTKYADNWPVHGWGKKDLSQTCFISPSRSQLTVASRLLNRIRRLPPKLKEIRRYPTYDIQGREFRAIFLSTSEPTGKDGETCNPTKSICDRYIFNTAITRAQSLVVSVGNPFILLREEQHMVKRYGNRGKCWSTYLQFCLEHNTLSIDPSLRVSKAEEERIICVLRECVQEQLSTNSIKVSPHKDKQPPSAQASAVSSHTADDKVLETPSQSYTPPPKPKTASLNEDGDDAGTEDILEREYVLKEELGRGGFGVVYHVRKKFDSVNYALKIIKLPTQKRQQDKVMREVRALANLDHPRIVRYFTSWAGKAPSNLKVLAALKSSESIACADDSTYNNMATEDSSAPTTPSSAHTPSQSTDTSVGEGMAESSTTDSVVEFCNDGSQKVTPTAALVPTSPSRPERPTCLFIQIQLCRKDTLREWLRNNAKNRPRKAVMDFFDQILDAVVYIHKEGMFHRDLKPSNIFFSLKEGSVKVGDFGLVTGRFATEHSEGERVQKSHSSQAGTLLYMAPEQLCGKKYDAKVDIFSLGVIFFELNCLLMTEMERYKVLNEVRNQKFPAQFMDKLPLEAKLIEWLLSPEPPKRPSAEEVAKSDQLRRLRTAVKKSRMECVPKLS